MKSNNLRHYLYSIAIMFIALGAFTSCDEDEMTGYTLVNGHWFGDLDMYDNYGEKAHGSEITFTPMNGYTNRYGTGIEVDYFSRGTIEHYFTWEIIDGVIQLEFADNHNLDCIIRDYDIRSYRFRGYIIPWDSWTGEIFEDDATRFDLYDYDYYWGSRGYGNYYDGYGYVKADVTNGDAFWGEGSADSTATNAKTSYIRGRNRARMLQEAAAAE
ncbi:MAG: hypothetical protein J5486_07730 [Bacteroidaceae bacterium]|nr:hypothetical protein [Bacteroidaceae bacterium]